MESSRDDFVIALRSAFLKKGTQQKFSILTLIIFSIIFLILGEINFKPINYIKIAIKEIAYRSTFIVSVPEKFIKESYYKVQSHLDLYETGARSAEILVQALRGEALRAFIAAGQVRKKRIDPRRIKQAHGIDQHPPHAVGFVKQGGDDQDTVVTPPVKRQRIFLALARWAGAGPRSDHSSWLCATLSSRKDNKLP